MSTTPTPTPTPARVRYLRIDGNVGAGVAALMIADDRGTPLTNENLAAIRAELDAHEPITTRNYTYRPGPEGRSTRVAFTPVEA